MILIIDDDFVFDPADVPYYTEEIAGEEFEYVGYDVIEVWRGER